MKSDKQLSLDEWFSGGEAAFCVDWILYYLLNFAIITDASPIYYFILFYPLAWARGGVQAWGGGTEVAA